ncbi:MAG: phage minor capsid protein [Ruminococcus sp.]|nr:phage minor capsid protein [Ruminococcus sp.]
MYTAGELERASMALDEPMNGLEHRIMTDIVRRIRDSGEITRAADWQITRLVQLGMGMAEISAAINEALGSAEDITSTLFENILKEGYVRDKSLYEAIGKVRIPFEENDTLQQLIGAVTSQTNETMHNITQSLGFAQRGADGRIFFTPIADYYQRTLDGAMLDISSGAFDYNTVLKRTVREMTDSGLRTVDYASGHSNRVDVAARRAVMTGMSQLTAQVNEQNAEQLDTEWFEISWHSGFRPTHWWGGRWYKKQQLSTICGLGNVAGLCGANCYHDYSPVIPGISEPTYTDEELAEMNRREQEPIEYNGKKYTKYEATQRQRQLETTMRAQREEMALLKEGGADEDDLINCRARYMGTSHEYATFSEAMGLPQERQRVSADGLGSIMKGNTEGGSGKESPVSVPPVGAHVTNKVTAEERKELLSQNKVDIHNMAVDKNQNNDIMKEKDIRDCKDYDELEKYLKESYNISIDGDIRGLDFESVRESLYGSETIIKEYPQLGETIKRVTISMQGAMGCTGEVITFNPSYYKEASKINELCKQQSESGWWIKNSSPASLGVHETAHAVERLLIDSNSSYEYDFMKTLAWDDCTEASKIIKQSILETKNTPYGKGKSKAALVTAISRYAQENDSETMAEAFADVFANGKEANPMSFIIKESTKQQYLSYLK